VRDRDFNCCSIIIHPVPGFDQYCTSAYRKGTSYRSQHKDLREAKLRDGKEAPCHPRFTFVSDVTEAVAPYTKLFNEMCEAGISLIL